ncbi:MAG: endopeptidase La [Anaerolineales bacterium]
MFGLKNIDTEDILAHLPADLPVLPLRNVVAYPFTMLPIAVGTPRALRLVNAAVEDDGLVVLVTSKDPELDEPGTEDVYKTGTLGIIQRTSPGEHDSLQMVVQTIERVKIDTWLAEEPYLRAEVTVAPDHEEDDDESEALHRQLVQVAKDVVDLTPNLPNQVAEFLDHIADGRLLSYTIAANAPMDLEQAQQTLEYDSVNAKMKLLLGVLMREKQLLEIGQRITNEVHEQVNQEQREFFLRRQLDSIKEELGETQDEAAELEDYREKIEAAGMTQEARDQAMRELQRMERIPPQSPEYGMIRTYLDWFIDLPWDNLSEDRLDIANARQVLEEDHYGLQDVKDRILEFLAVRKLAKDRSEPDTDAEPRQDDGSTIEGTGAILLFVGPPGVGKTSLGKSIARALGREFTRMSLGGMRDEAEIRGHRRTYIGAMPGRIIQAIKRVGTRNPVFMLDEVDKIGSDWRGDPSSALLEVLDPQQNNAFRDYYLDVDFDLSDTIFIATANQLDTIPGPLQDRMEVIRVDGYTEYDKMHIARQYLVPRQLRVNSLHADEITFTEDALQRLIREYTREAGVRNLEREIGSVMRKVAIKIADGSAEHVTVDEDNVQELLGNPKFRFQGKQGWDVPGVAAGLAWTPVGGDVLYVEAARTPGAKGNMTITGQLGKVMEESVRIAYSYLRSHAPELGIDAASFVDADVHIHVPEGAVPKDGPSAGITMLTALYSLLVGLPVRNEVAMTGEITLRGEVLPVGGIKMKVLAAHRSGMQTIILPAKNMDDLDDLPEEVRNDMTFVAVRRIDEVLAAAIQPVELTQPGHLAINADDGESLIESVRQARS